MSGLIVRLLCQLGDGLERAIQGTKHQNGDLAIGTPEELSGCAKVALSMSGSSECILDSYSEAELVNPIR